MTFKFAETTQVDRNRGQVDKLMSLVGEFMDWDEDDLAMVFISDQSSLSDFSLDEYEITEIEDMLGVEIDPHEYLWQIAERMQ